MNFSYFLLVMSIFAVNFNCFSMQRRQYRPKLKKPAYIKALEAGNNEKVLQELQYVKRVRFVHPYTQQNSLHLCARHSDSVEVAKELFKGGETRVNAKDKNGNTPFLLAIAHQKLHFALFALLYGADLNTKNNDGFSAQTFDAKRCSAESLFVNAIQCRYAESVIVNGEEELVPIRTLLVSKLLDAGWSRASTMLPLHACAGTHDGAVVEILLKAQDVDIDAFDIYGRTALCKAVCVGDGEVVQALLEGGANPLVKRGKCKDQIALIIKYFKQENYIREKAASVQRDKAIALTEQVIKSIADKYPELAEKYAQKLSVVKSCTIRAAGASDCLIS